MSFAFIAIAALTLASAIAAMSLRNLVHCALMAALTFAGLAALFLQLQAEFVGLAQILVYVGAVAILIVFAILLTRGSEPTPQPIFSRSWAGAVGVAALVGLTLTASILASPVRRLSGPAEADVSADVAVQRIGTNLMTENVLPLEILALLLTAAMIGAVIVAMHDKEIKA